MSTFFLFGKYTASALKGITDARTKRASKLIEKYGGNVISMHAVLGNYDLIFIVDMPDLENAIKASVALGKATGITFTSSPALPVNQFDNIISKV